MLRFESGNATQGAFRGWTAWGVLALLLAIFVVLFADSAGSGDHKLRLTVDAPQGGALQIYYQTQGGLSEEQSVRSPLVSGTNQLVFNIKNEAITGLRLDPEPGTPLLLVRELTIQDPGAHAAKSLPLTGLQGVAEIRALEVRANGVAILPSDGAKDPQAWLPVDESHASAGELAFAVRWAQRLLMLFLLVAFARAMAFSPEMPVAPMMLVALALSVTLAFSAVTGHSVHPDEFNHASAAAYYATHWIPPGVTDPAIANTYSIYGTSYLNELDIVYLIAAKTAKLWSGLGINKLIALRLFNVLLFAILAVLVAWRRQQGWALCLLLMTPQIWYVFSYFNADAFPLFLAIVLAWMAGPMESRLAQYVDGRGRYFAVAAIFAVLLALLLISKRNYLTVVYVLAMFMALRHLRTRVWTAALGLLGATLLLFAAVAGRSMELMLPAGVSEEALLLFAALLLLVPVADLLHAFLRIREVRMPALRLASIFGLALLLAAPRVWLDNNVNGNGQQKTESMKQVAERYADVRFKPSTFEKNPQSSYPGLYLAAKGATLPQVIGQPYGWFQQTWRSVLGVYGYMNIFAPQALYFLMALGWGIVLLSIFIASWADPAARKYLWLVTGGTLLVAISSITHSWANDFQPQGRYLFPAFAMLAAYLAAFPAVLRTRLARFGIALSFAGAIISMITVAMPALTHG